jgi:hypothetical protein
MGDVAELWKPIARPALEPGKTRFAVVGLA